MSTSVLLRVVLAVVVIPAHAEHVTMGWRAHTSKQFTGFLQTQSAADFRDELHQAVFDALGLDHGLDLTHLDTIRKDLTPMWASLAKNAYGRVDRRSLRYALHRYFMKVHSISIIGLEPLQHQGQTNDEANLVMGFAPKYVKQVLHEGDEHEQGYSINDAVAMVATLRELVKHHNFEKLEKLYVDRGWDLKSSFNRTSADAAVQDYLIRWLIGEDKEGLRILDGKPEAQEKYLDHYHEMMLFARGHVRAFEQSKWRKFGHTQQSKVGNAKLDGLFTFHDIEVITGDMVLSFGSFWHTECMRIKSSLTAMDHGSIGRVKLSDFHGAALNGEWRFAESKDYLKTIGALDDTSLAHGPRVIVSNYLQGVSNCMASGAHYRVCCPSECEDYMADIEEQVGAPYATPEHLLSIIAGMTTDLDDGAPRVTAHLKTQLHQIAGIHLGTVPLHGRLFAQWLHYLFPQECVFPHAAGSAKSMSTHEFGESYMASRSEMIVNRNAKTEAHREPTEGADWMSQWSAEEELLSEHIRLHAPWEIRSPLRSSVTLATLASAVGIVVFGVRRVVGTKKGQHQFDFSTKEHFV